MISTATAYRHRVDIRVDIALIAIALISTATVIFPSTPSLKGLAARALVLDWPLTTQLLELPQLQLIRSTIPLPSSCSSCQHLPRFWSAWHQFAPMHIAPQERGMESHPRREMWTEVGPTSTTLPQTTQTNTHTEHTGKRGMLPRQHTCPHIRATGQGAPAITT